MRIGIDCTFVRADRLTGVERYALSLSRALAELAPAEIVLFVRADAPKALAALPVEQHVAPRANRIVVDQLWLPVAARRARVDALHTLAFPTPVAWRGSAAMTIHDATPWLHPDTLSAGMRFYYRPLYAQALRRATVVFTISEASRSDIARTTGFPAERIIVTPNGVEPIFHGTSRRVAAEPYVLTVGTVEPRKNVQTLVDAFRLLRRDRPDLRLVIAGRQGWGPRLDLRGVEPFVRLTGTVSDDELAQHYAGAACFALPSRYEGFGLPLGEAMAVGTPCVASDVPALRELGGDAVSFVPVGDPAALARGIARALAGGSAKPEARTRARQLTWRACAEATLDGYRHAFHPAPKYLPMPAPNLDRSPTA